MVNSIISIYLFYNNMQASIPTYILYSERETERAVSIKVFKKTFTQLTIVPSVYPKYTHVPYLEKLIQKSKERTGAALKPSEIGCLLGHRKIWQDIVRKASNDQEHYLVMESDSKILDMPILSSEFKKYTQPFDLFFWGAWDGHISIKRSSILYHENGHKVGTPLIKSVYCTYGYSINKKAAQYLLAQTRKISYPVDMFKHFVAPGSIKIGGIQKEIISTWSNMGSYIRSNTIGSSIKRFLILLVFTTRNAIQAFFS